MVASPRYVFRKATSDDLAMLNAWLSEPHVREWWDARAAYSEEDLADARVARRIVLADERPFAFMQDYAVHAWPDHHFSDLPAGSRGIDQFIGDPQMVGRGHGRAFIAARMQVLFEKGVPVLAADPHPDNARAIAVYRKLGFEVTGPVRQTRWGVVLPMTARR